MRCLFRAQGLDVLIIVPPFTAVPLASEAAAAEAKGDFVFPHSRAKQERRDKSSTTTIPDDQSFSFRDARANALAKAAMIRSLDRPI